jgi:hypothetical protein
MTLFEEIKKSVPMEIRVDSKDYLEGVVDRQGLDLLLPILTKYLGTAAKGPGQKADFPPQIVKLVASMGSLRLEQSFYYKEEKNRVTYAALWPWGSNPHRATLKSGVSDL